MFESGVFNFGIGCTYILGGMLPSPVSTWSERDHDHEVAPSLGPSKTTDHCCHKGWWKRKKQREQRRCQRQQQNPGKRQRRRECQEQGGCNPSQELSFGGILEQASRGDAKPGTSDPTVSRAQAAMRAGNKRGTPRKKQTSRRKNALPPSILQKHQPTWMQCAKAPEL